MEGVGGVRDEGGHATEHTTTCLFEHFGWSFLQRVVLVIFEKLILLRLVLRVEASEVQDVCLSGKVKREEHWTSRRQFILNSLQLVIS